MAEFRFKIDARYSPETIPMHRLAEYMADIAVILGEQENVHFVALEDGSVGLVSNIEDRAVEKARERAESTRRGHGPPEAISAARNINRRLTQDRGTGTLVEGPKESPKELIRFLGEQPPSIKAFSEQGSLDGIVVLVGGKSNPVSVHLESIDPS